MQFVTPFQRDLFDPESGDSTKSDLCTKGKVGVALRPLDEKTYFFEVVEKK